LSAVTGQSTTQLRVGQFDLQFTFGHVDFLVMSPVELRCNGQRVARWEQGRWPEPAFLNAMNSTVDSCKVVGDSRIVIAIENGLEMHLEDSSDSTNVCTSDSRGSTVFG